MDIIFASLKFEVYLKRQEVQQQRLCNWDNRGCEVLATACKCGHHDWQIPWPWTWQGHCIHTIVK